MWHSGAAQVGRVFPRTQTREYHQPNRRRERLRREVPLLVGEVESLFEAAIFAELHRRRRQRRAAYRPAFHTPVNAARLHRIRFTPFLPQGDAVLFGSITILPTVDLGQLEFSVTPTARFGSITVTATATFAPPTIRPW